MLSLLIAIADIAVRSAASAVASYVAKLDFSDARNSQYIGLI